MSISSRVTQGFEKYTEGDAESALYQICSAMEGTSRKEGYAHTRQGYKSWVVAYMPVITGVGIGMPVAGLKIPYSHPELPALPAGQSQNLEDIIYHVARCDQYHTGGLPADIQFTENKIGSGLNGELLLIKTVVLGMIVSVVLSPANATETTNDSFVFGVRGKRQFKLNELWGKRDAFLPELTALLAK